MELSIHECPACRAPVMEDTEQCPICQHDLRQPAVSTVRGTLVAGNPITEQICSVCGDSMRTGVVRCRNCGAFLNRDLEAAFLAKTGLKEVPLVPIERRAFVKRMDDDDFELTPEATAAEFDSIDESHIVPMSGDDEDFELRTPTTEYQDDFDVVEESETKLASKPTTDEFDLRPKTVSSATEPPATAASSVTEKPDSTPKAEVAPKPVETKTTMDTKTTPEAASAPNQTPAGDSKTAETPTVAHSVATGGDALLAVALQEETDAEKRRRMGLNRPRRKTDSSDGDEGFLIHCPYGHRIMVQEKHRGRMGRCPSCKAPFIVPAAPVAAVAGETSPATGDAEAAAQPAMPAGPMGSHTLAARYPQGLDGLHLHRVVLAKLKIKPGSLVDDYETADIGMNADHLLVVTLFAGGGLLGGLGAAKKISATRDAVREAIRAGVPLKDLPAPKHRQFNLDEVYKLKLVQPNAPDEDSVFANVPVFGVGRIAVQFAVDPATGERFCLSFSLTEFRKFSEGLSAVYQIPDFGAIRGIPLENSTTTKTCHYSENKLKIIEQPEFYQHDTAFKVVLAGWECQHCGLVVSEDSRKKEKIGGSSGSKIEKHPCPKCKRPFGSKPLYSLKD